ncbi:MAG: type III pantothenate kinase, partial [Endozoicomonas sp.]
TAITIDLVDQQGGHHGGYITPGITLMKTALKANTVNLDLVQQLPESTGPGRNRSECINQGVLAMVVAMINAQLNYYSDPVVYITGGDGCLLVPFVNAQCRLIPELVMDGLALAFAGFEESYVGRANALGCS